jgi:uncharacterized damage-inducible protein DinB
VSAEPAGSAAEAWLRGPVSGIVPALLPIAHTFIQVHEEVATVVARLGEMCWAKPVFGGWSVGQHVVHLAGSTDRLLTYADGRALSAEQVEVVRSERKTEWTAGDRPPLAPLADRMRVGAFEALIAWSRRPVDDLYAPREVGRARLPSTVLGLLYHAAEHAQRHAGQIAIIARTHT